MKRTISVILTVIMLAISVFALAACSGGVETEEDWNGAVQALKDAKSITVKQVEKEYHNVLRLDKKIITKVYYNAKQGALAYYRDETKYTFLGIKDGARHTYRYYKVDGSDIKLYTKGYYDALNYSNEDEWEVSTTSYSSHEEALQELHGLYLWLSPARAEYIDFTIYNNQHSFGKFEKTKSDDYYDYTYGLQFSGGKLTKIYDSRELNSTNGGKATKATTTIKYSAIVRAPKGIRNATEFVPPEEK